MVLGGYPRVAQALKNKNIFQNTFLKLANFILHILDQDMDLPNIQIIFMKTIQSIMKMTNF